MQAGKPNLIRRGGDSMVNALAVSAMLHQHCYLNILFN